MVLDHDNARANVCKQTSGFAADVTKTLQRHFRAFDFDPVATSHFTTGDEDAAAGGFFTAQRTAEMNRFTGNHAGDSGAVIHGVGVHHPRHHFTVGANVRRRDIFLWPNDNADFTGIATSQTFQLAFRQ